MERQNLLETLAYLIRECEEEKNKKEIKPNDPMAAHNLQVQLNQVQETLRIVLLQNDALRDMVRNLEAELRSASQFNTRSNY